MSLSGKRCDKLEECGEMLRSMGKQLKWWFLRCKNNQNNGFSFTNTDFYDSIKKKSGIIKLKGEVYERKIIYNARIYNGKRNQGTSEGTASDAKGVCGTD